MLTLSHVTRAQPSQPINKLPRTLPVLAVSQVLCPSQNLLEAWLCAPQGCGLLHTQGVSTSPRKTHTGGFRVKHTVTARDSDKAVTVPGKCRIVCARIQNKGSRDQQHGVGPHHSSCDSVGHCSPSSAVVIGTTDGHSLPAFLSEHGCPRDLSPQLISSVILGSRVSVFLRYWAMASCKNLVSME